jgi:hypothetical protein
MKREKTLFCNVIFIFSLWFGALGCSRITDFPILEDMIYRISLDREEYTLYTPTGSDFSSPETLEVMVTNTGNQLLEDLAVVLSGVDKQIFSVSPESISSLFSGETAVLTVSFPQEDPAAAVFYAVDLLVGNSNAAKKLSIKYSVFDLMPAGLNIDPPLLQMDYEGHTSAAVSTDDPDKGASNLWFSNNADIAAINGETGVLSVTGNGETIVGFIVTESPLLIKGQKVRVYPAAESLNPEYPVNAGVLTRPSGGTALPLNLPAIQSAAGVNSLVFSLAGGDGVISNFDGDTGELTFSGNDQTSADLSVDLIITKAVPEGVLPIYKGSASFKARIGSTPAATMVSAETVNDPESIRASLIEVTFSDFISGEAGNIKNGFTIAKNGTPLIIQTAVINGAKITFTLDAGTPVVFGDAVTIAYNPSEGNIASSGTPAALFGPLPVTNNLADLAPWPVRAVVENNTPNIVRVVFSEPVTLQDVSKFRVKVNAAPKADIANSLSGDAPITDYGSDSRTVTGAVSAGGDDTAWNLTISAPAAYGDIIMLSAAEAGAVKDKGAAPNDLPKIPQFIIQNLIKRQKASYEAEAGFYRNGLKIDSVTNGDGNDLYQNTINHLTASGNYPQLDEVLTVVLDSDQTYTGSTNFSATHIPTSLIGGDTRLIITSKTGNTQDYVITVTGNGAGIVGRNGLTVIIDEHIVFDHNNANNNNALIVVNDGGKVILDGGEIRNNVNTSTSERAGGVRLGGGSYGAHFIMNGGKITGNSVSASGNDSTSNHGGAGGVYIQQYGVFVIHGGEISNNTLNLTGTVTTPKAGAVSVRYSTATYHANASIFITGGTISGNKVLGAKNVVSAGAIYTNGAFQKTGGTIYGSDAEIALRNYSEYTGTVNAGAVVIGNTVAANPARDAVTKRDNTAGPEVILRADSYKTANGSAGINTVPGWAKNYWDE